MEIRKMNFDNRVKVISVATSICAVVIAAISYFFPSTNPKQPASDYQSTHADALVSAPNNSGTINQNNKISNTYNNPIIKEPDPNSEAGARIELQRRLLPFTGQGFESAIVLDTSEIVKLYLQAGSSPNDYMAGTPFFPLYMAMQNSGDALAIVETLLNYHPDLNKINTAKQFGGYPPMTMGQQAMFEAIRRGRVDIVSRLLQAGVNPRIFVKHANNIVCDPVGFGAGQVLTMQKAGLNVHACGK